MCDPYCQTKDRRIHRVACTKHIRVPLAPLSAAPQMPPHVPPPAARGAAARSLRRGDTTRADGSNETTELSTLRPAASRGGTVTTKAPGAAHAPGTARPQPVGEPARGPAGRSPPTPAHAAPAATGAHDAPCAGLNTPRKGARKGCGANPSAGEGAAEANVASSHGSGVGGAWLPYGRAMRGLTVGAAATLWLGIPHGCAPLPPPSTGTAAPLS